MKDFSDNFLKVSSHCIDFKSPNNIICDNTATEYAEIRVIYKVLSGYQMELWFSFQMYIIRGFTM